MMKRDMTNRTVLSLGYFDRKEALTRLDREEVRCFTDGPYGRMDELREVKKFIDVFRPGEPVRATLRYKHYRGMVLGYRKHRTRGWVMGLLLLDGGGKVKDITIDPKGYELYEPEWLKDPNGKTVSILSPYDLIVIVTKTAA